VDLAKKKGLIVLVVSDIKETRRLVETLIKMEERNVKHLVAASEVLTWS
jgi:hypothetical protein